MKQPYLGSPTYTIAVLNHHHISARKRFGQNFLIDASVLEDTITAAGIGPEDFVLEVGPGIGTLTQYLASAAGRVLAVEIDRSLLPVLEDTLSGWNNVEILSGDILRMDLAALVREKNGGRPIKVAANLPYYITTPVILMLLESGAPISGITVMVQKEVAERMEAEPGTKAYGALSLAVQYYARAERVRDVAPSSFLPQPGVTSSLIHLAIYAEKPVRAENETLLFDVVRASFAQRRKKLANGLAAGLGISKEEAESALSACGFNPAVRGEKLSLRDFAQLSDEIGRRIR